MNIKAAIILFPSKTLSNGEHPIMLRITKGGKRKYLSTGLSSKIEHWNLKKQIPRSSNPNKEFIEIFKAQKENEYRKMILEIKGKGGEPTIEGLINAVEAKNKSITVFDYFDKKINEFKSVGRIGNSNVYSDTKSSFLKAVKSKNIEFSDVDVQILNKWARYLKQNNIQNSTINMRFRTLRSLFNKAINEGLASKENYPFNNFKISQFKSESKPRAISIEDIKKIEKKSLPKGLSKFRSRQYFLVSFYGAGINFSDIANLRWKNIVDGRITYTRKKTGKEISFIILPYVQNAINYWKDKTYRSEDDYVFPILDKEVHKTPIQIDNRVHKVLTSVNKDLKEIGADLKIKTPLTTYVARHSFATTLKNKHVHSRIIGDILGHADEKTTEIYLSKFDNKVYDTAMNELL